MYSQFQSRYPGGSLISKLLQIHEGQYVVQAEVLVGGSTLASGLAAATTIEQAEDQARARALVVLGIHLPNTSYESQAQLMESTGRDYSRPARLNPANADREPASEFLTQAPERRTIQSQAASLSQGGLQSMGLASGRDMQALAESEITDWTWPQADDSDLPEFVANLETYVEPEAEAENGSEPELLAWQATLTPPLEKPTRNLSQSQRHNGQDSSRAQAEASAPDEPIDLSDIIAQTSIELKRLGWSDARGRTHLQRTYNKRSRQQLTDEELLEFLYYLKAQPAANEPSF